VSSSFWPQPTIKQMLAMRCYAPVQLSTTATETGVLRFLTLHSGLLLNRPVIIYGGCDFFRVLMILVKRASAYSG
jgi:hypothetical protein